MARAMDFTQHLMPKAPDQEVPAPMEPPQPAANVEIPEERIAKLHPKPERVDVEWNGSCFQTLKRTSRGSKTRLLVLLP